MHYHLVYLVLVEEKKQFYEQKTNKLVLKSLFTGLIIIFRYLNEQLYLANGKEAYQLFNEDPESFEAYHTGFKQQIAQWPINPLDIVIKSLRHR